MISRWVCPQDRKSLLTTLHYWRVHQEHWIGICFGAMMKTWLPRRCRLHSHLLCFTGHEGTAIPVGNSSGLSFIQDPRQTCQHSKGKFNLIWIRINKMIHWNLSAVGRFPLGCICCRGIGCRLRFGSLHQREERPRDRWLDSSGLRKSQSLRVGSLHCLGYFRLHQRLRRYVLAASLNSYKQLENLN